MTKSKPKREGPLSVPFDFEGAMRRVLKVKPPPEGWVEHERQLREKRKKRPRVKESSI